MFNSRLQFFRPTTITAAILLITISQMKAGENRPTNRIYEVSPTGQIIADTFVGTKLKAAMTIAGNGQNSWSLIGITDGEAPPSSLYYYERSSGTVAVISNRAEGATGNILATPGNGWTPAAIADFNNDGHPDVAFVNDATGQVDIFFYGGDQGTSFLSRETITSLSAAGWKVVGAADVDGDGHADLILQNPSSGQVLVNYLGGAKNTNVTKTGELAGEFAGWTAVGMQDMNADGHADLILVNDMTGRIMVSSYSPGAVPSTGLGATYLDTPVSPGWKLVVARGISPTNQPIQENTQLAEMDGAPLEAPAQVQSVPVLIFNGTGTSTNDVTAVENIVSNAGLAYRTVNSSQLDGMTQAQLLAYKLFIVPGGNSIKIGDNLTSKATFNVRSAVSNGLHYLGICAGGFFGGYSRYHNGLDLTNGVWFNFYADYFKGINKEAVSISFPKQAKLDIYWQDGPELAKWGYVVGKYPNGTPAIVEGHWGTGFVILSGVHPEAPASWRYGMNFYTPVQVDLAYATTLVKSALNGTMLPHY